MAVPLLVRFETQVDRSGGLDACHLWTGNTNRTGGYAVIYDNDTKGRRYAHRVAWEVANGAVPPDKYVLHRCDVPHCVNPAHLFLGTLADNNADKARKGRGTTGRLPVGVVRKGRRFAVVLSVTGRMRGFGTCGTLEEAAARAAYIRGVLLGLRGIIDQ